MQFWKLKYSFAKDSTTLVFHFGQYLTTLILILDILIRIEFLKNYPVYTYGMLGKAYFLFYNKKNKGIRYKTYVL